MRKNLWLPLLAFGFITLGCGGTEPEPTPDLTTREDALPDCTDKNYGNIFYSDAAHTSIVGSNGCSCGNWYTWGRFSAFQEYVEYEPCF
jgi:hypothetical protein